MMKEPWIYLVLLGAVIAVFGWLKPHKDQNSDSFRRNMEDTLEHYVDEITTENEKLLQVVEKMKQEQGVLQDATRRRMDKMEAGIHILSEKLEFMQSLQVAERRDSYAELHETEQPPVRRQHALEDVGHADGFTSYENSPVSDIDLQPEDIIEESIRNRYQQLFALLDQGVEASAAAEQLHLPLGEVQLIIQLALQEERRV